MNHAHLHKLVVRGIIYVQIVQMVHNLMQLIQNVYYVNLEHTHLIILEDFVNHAQIIKLVVKVLQNVKIAHPDINQN